MIFEQERATLGGAAITVDEGTIGVVGGLAYLIFISFFLNC